MVLLNVIELRYNFATMPIFHDPFLDNDNEWEQRDDQMALLRLELGDYGYIFEHRRPDDSWTTWQPVVQESTGLANGSPGPAIPTTEILPFFFMTSSK